VVALGALRRTIKYTERGQVYGARAAPWQRDFFLSEPFFASFMALTPTNSLPIHTLDGLPDPSELPGADVVIYDGDCNFCIGQVKNLRRLDCCGGRLAFLSLHDPRVEEHYPDLTHEQLMAQMYVIDGKNRRHGGGDAVRYLSRRLPLLWPVAPILHLPGSASLWRWMYNQVARRRYKIAGRKTGEAVCENDACAVHLGD
jgi:predicted DCC family thiol-disulfide oxidoreductase YuxK